VVGAWSSGGLEKWNAVLFSARSYLLIWRIFVYTVIAGFWYSAYRIYQAKGDNASLGRMKRIGFFCVLLAVFIEVPKLFW